MNEWMHKVNVLLVSMAVNKYRKNGSTDWRQRPECSHILSQLQTFITNKPIIRENELKLIITNLNDNTIWKLFLRSKPFCFIRSNNQKTSLGLYLKKTIKIKGLLSHF